MNPIEPAPSVGPTVASRAPLTLAQRFVLLLCVALLTLLSVRRLDNSDIGFHLRMGERILSGDGWPRTDPLTYTVSDHAYVDTSWGYQVLAAISHRAAGTPGVVMLHSFFILVAFIFAFLTARRGPAEPTTLIVVLLLAVLGSEMRFEARPELLSLAMFSVLLHLMARRFDGTKSPLFFIPALFLVWANCHSFFFLGWIVAACFLAGQAVGRRRVDGPLAGSLALAGLVCVINPYGLRGVLFPLTLLTRFDSQNIFGQTIGELSSPFSLRLSTTMPFFAVWSIYSFRLFALLSLLAVPAIWRRRQYGWLLVWAIFLILSGKMVRNMAMLTVTAFPMTVNGLSASEFWSRLRLQGRRAEKPIRGVLLAALSLLCIALGARVATNAYYMDDRRPQRTGWSWNRIAQPVDAAEYIRRAALPGRMFNYLGFGGYLAWSLNSPVFIDGRLEVIGESFYEEYLRMLKSPSEFDAGAGRRDVDWAIFPFAAAPELLKGLSEDAGWRLAYYDHVAVIFVRSGAAGASLIDDAVLLPRKLERIPIRSLPGLGGGPRVGSVRHWFDGLIGRCRIDRELYGRGVFHLIRGEWREAETEFAAVIRQNEGAYYEIYFNLGGALHEQGRTKEAADCYQVVLEETPDNPIALQRSR